jgi:ATP-dependent Lon protease
MINTFLLRAKRQPRWGVMGAGTAPIYIMPPLRRSVRIKQRDNTYVCRTIETSDSSSEESEEYIPLEQKGMFVELTKYALNKAVTYTEIANAPCSRDIKYYAMMKVTELLETVESGLNCDYISENNALRSLISIPETKEELTMYTTVSEIQNSGISSGEYNHAMFLLALRNREPLGSSTYDAFDEKIKKIIRGNDAIMKYKAELIENKKGINKSNYDAIAKWIALEESTNENNEKHKIIDKIKVSLRIPHGLAAVDTVTTDEFIAAMNAEMYGMDAIKIQLLQMYYSPNTSHAVAITGPPGIGKTKICKAFSIASKRPIAFINIGAMKDTTALTGTFSSWLGAEPGTLVKSLMEMNANNGIIVLDEIDKIDMTKNYSIFSTLLTILDPSQNSEFSDEFIAEIKIDLSKITFICTMNDIEEVSPILRDRLKIIHCKGYTQDEKVALIVDYFVPRFAKEFSIDPAPVMTVETAILAINATKGMNNSNAIEPGVRSLIKIIKSAIEWINFISKAKSANLQEITKKSHKDYPLTYAGIITNDLITAIAKSLSVIKNSSCDANVSHLYL